MSVGVKVTDRDCVPAAKTVPATGEYTNVPGIVERALSWLPPRVVPEMTAAGVFQEIVGVALLTVNVTV